MRILNHMSAHKGWTFWPLRAGWVIWHRHELFLLLFHELYFFFLGQVCAWYFFLHITCCRIRLTERVWNFSSALVVCMNFFFCTSMLAGYFFFQKSNGPSLIGVHGFPGCLKVRIFHQNSETPIYFILTRFHTTRKPGNGFSVSSLPVWVMSRSSLSGKGWDSV